MPRSLQGGSTRTRSKRRLGRARSRPRSGRRRSSRPCARAVRAQRVGAAGVAARRRRSRPRRPSARRGGWSCRRARRTGRARARPGAGASARATAIAARDCGISRPCSHSGARRRRTGASRISASSLDARWRTGQALGELAAVDLERVGAQRGLGGLVVGGHQRAGVVGAERVEPQLRDPLRVGVGERGLGGRGVGQRGDDRARLARGAAQDGVDEAGAARARRPWRARRTRRRRRARARGRGRSAGRPRGAARRAPAASSFRPGGGPALDHVVERGDALDGAVASCVASARSRGSSRRRRASPCRARSAQAPCSNTRRTTAYAHARAGATPDARRASMVRPVSCEPLRARRRSDWLASAARQGWRMGASPRTEVQFPVFSSR